jgi:uncharacterized protein YyaL (SSP411 family)
MIETVGYLGRELRDPCGGLYASLDADSEGEEGKFYVWTPAQVARRSASVDALQFCKAYGVTSAGNFEHGAERAGAGHAARGALRRGSTWRAAGALLAARAGRVAPATDDKVLAGWNGLAMTGLVRRGTPPGTSRRWRWRGGSATSCSRT